LAASSAWLGAHPSRAAALASAAAAHVTESGLRAQLLTLQGQIAWNTRSLHDGYDLIVQAAQAAGGVDEELGQQLAMLAASLAAFGARSPRASDPTTLVPGLTPDAPARARAADALLHGFVAVARSDWATAAGCFQQAFALTDAEPVEDHVLQPNLGVAAFLIDDDERALLLHEQQLTAARRAGALPMVEHALTRGFHSQISKGDWSRAAAAAAEALPLAASTGHPGMTALPTVELALVAALRGEESADQHLAEVDEIRGRHPVGITDGLVVDFAHWARGLRASGQSAAYQMTALHHLEQIQGPWVRRMAALDLFDAAVRGERPDVARAWLEELIAFAEGTGSAGATAVVEHGRALLADAGDTERHFELALAAHANASRLPNRARTELAFGEWLRRARRRVDAREHLRAALIIFEQLGATPWADRAAQELRASGETARRRHDSTPTDLTPQERLVAGLVRQGLSNRDAAARLFVSPRTVDFHLRNVFSKLGVASRAELTALALDL
jgi:DNA-binding CsgD family transcriptional regulator